MSRSPRLPSGPRSEPPSGQNPAKSNAQGADRGAAEDQAELVKSGERAIAAGRFDVAEKAARALLSNNKRDPNGHLLVGLMALERKQPRLAIEAFKSLAALAGEQARSWILLARAFAQAGQGDNALIALDRAIQKMPSALQPAEAGLADMIGVIFALLDDMATAHAWHNKAVQADPRPVFLMNRSKTAIFVGDIKQARADLNALLAATAPLTPALRAEALWLMVRLTGGDEPAGQALLRQIDRLSVEADDQQSRAYLDYAKGKLLEDQSQWQAAFAAFQSGARAKAQVITYSKSETAAFYDALDACALPKVQPSADAKSQSVPEGRPIFIMGLPRTGSTLLERMLGAHSLIREGGELPFAPRVFKALTGVTALGPGNADLVNRLPQINLAEAGGQYLASVQAGIERAAQDGVELRCSKPYFTDKLPNNFHYLPWLRCALPGAIFVHIMRHPMDAIFAGFKQLFADAYPHSYALDTLAEQYIRYHRLMARWRTHMGDDLIELAYEDLAADPAAILSQTMPKMGLAYEPQQIAFAARQAPTSTASAVQVREAAHQRSVGRWQHYQAELSGVVEKLQAAGIAC